jgi:hypothetical protein
MIDNATQFATMLAVSRGRHKPMTAAQYNRAIESTGLNQEGAGRFFGRSRRTGQGWALGETPVPFPVQCCLEYMVAYEMTADAI